MRREGPSFTMLMMTEPCYLDVTSCFVLIAVQDGKWSLVACLAINGVIEDTALMF